MIATKEEERKALEKIRKIVEGIGEDSYLSMAFEGCFDDAEANINEDAGYSFKNRYEYECALNKRLNDEIDGKNIEIERLNKELSDAKAMIDDMEKERLTRDEKVLIRMCVNETTTKYRKCEKEAYDGMVNASLEGKDDDVLYFSHEYKANKEFADMIQRVVGNKMK